MLKLICVAIVLLLISGCGLPSVKEQVADNLPNGASNIQYIGEYWTEFDYKGKRILMRNQYRRSAMTVIGDASGKTD